MATIRAFQIPGLRIWFWSNDHDPPHFHVQRRGEWVIKVEFLASAEAMFEVVSGKRPKAAIQKKLAELVAAHRAELLEQWDELHQS